MVYTRSNMQPHDLNSNTNLRKVSGILQTALLESTSILLQVHNTTNSLALNSFMEPITSMTTTGIIMILNLLVFNNILHQTRMGKLYTKIFALTVYTRIDIMKKDRAFSKRFCTNMNKQMVSYQPCLYVKDNTS